MNREKGAVPFFKHKFRMTKGGVIKKSGLSEFGFGFKPYSPTSRLIALVLAALFLLHRHDDELDFRYGVLEIVIEIEQGIEVVAYFRSFTIRGRFEFQLNALRVGQKLIDERHQH